MNPLHPLKNRQAELQSSSLLDRVGTLVHAEAIHSDGLDLSQKIRQGPAPGNF